MIFTLLSYLADLVIIYVGVVVTIIFGEFVEALIKAFKKENEKPY